MASTHRARRGTTFPIVEAFGYAHDSNAAEARRAQENHFCRFANGPCEKYSQYGYGYCSVTYSAEWDSSLQTYAVCDHRLDGEPVQWAVKDHFGDSNAVLVPEVTVTTAPKLSIDYMAYRNDAEAEEGVDLIAIETQAIDLRGGGVGPAWRAWEGRDADNWREYFTREASRKGRRDTIDYGVNVGNVYKRLATQVAIKGSFLHEVRVPLYVIMQDSILKRLRLRVDFEVVDAGADWDITFVSFDYGDSAGSNGAYDLKQVDIARTTLAMYQQALTGSKENVANVRSDLIRRVKKKHFRA